METKVKIAFAVFVVCIIGLIITLVMKSDAYTKYQADAEAKQAKASALQAATQLEQANLQAQLLDEQAARAEADAEYKQQLAQASQDQKDEIAAIAAAKDAKIAARDALIAKRDAEIAAKKAKIEEHVAKYKANLAEFPELKKDYADSQKLVEQYKIALAGAFPLSNCSKYSDVLTAAHEKANPNMSVNVLSAYPDDGVATLNVDGVPSCWYRYSYELGKDYGVSFDTIPFGIKPNGEWEASDKMNVDHKKADVWRPADSMRTVSIVMRANKPNEKNLMAQIYVRSNMCKTGISYKSDNEGCGDDVLVNEFYLNSTQLQKMTLDLGPEEHFFIKVSKTKMKDGSPGPNLIIQQLTMMKGIPGHPGVLVNLKPFLVRGDRTHFYQNTFANDALRSQAVKSGNFAWGGFNYFPLTGHVFGSR